MKKLIFAALAIVSFASCVKNEVAVVEDNSPISFQTVVGTPTKAPIDGNDYPTDLSFGSAAYKSDNSSFIDISEVRYGDYVANKWTTEKAYYWEDVNTDETQRNLTFFSFSPWSMYDSSVPNITITPATPSVSINGWDVSEHQDDDVMLADVVTASGNGTNDNGVTTIFRHQLTYLAGFRFNLLKDYGTDVTISINKISINGIEVKGNFATTSVSTENTDKGKITGVWTPVTGSVKKSYVWGYYATPVEVSYTDQSSSTELSYTAPNNTLDSTVDTGKNTVNAPTDAANGTTHAAKNGYLFVLPQSFENNADACIVIDYTVTRNSADEEMTATKFLKDIVDEASGTAHVWGINKMITYNITLSTNTDRILWDPEVKSWDSEVVSIKF